MLPAEFTVETVGVACYTQEKIMTILDTIARWLYQENKQFMLIKAEQ